MLPPSIPTKILSSLPCTNIHTILGCVTVSEFTCRNMQEYFLFSNVGKYVMNPLSFTFNSLPFLLEKSHPCNHRRPFHFLLLLSRHFPLLLLRSLAPLLTYSPSLLLFLSAHGESALALLPSLRPFVYSC